jgi:hypothetical protein
MTKIMAAACATLALAAGAKGATITYIATGGSRSLETELTARGFTGIDTGNFYMLFYVSTDPDSTAPIGVPIASISTIAEYDEKVDLWSNSPHLVPCTFFFDPSGNLVADFDISYMAYYAGGKNATIVTRLLWLSDLAPTAGGELEFYATSLTGNRSYLTSHTNATNYNTNILTVNVFHVVVPIPEPLSAGLALAGGAVLLLRRKRR